MKLLHVIPSLGPGGAARSLVQLVRQIRHLQPDIAQTVLILQRGEYMPRLFELAGEGAEVLRAPKDEVAAGQISMCDVVLLHFWNTPRMWRLFNADLPASRYILWSLVLGSTAPQRLNETLLCNVASVVTTAPLPTAHLVQTQDPPLIPGFADWRRLESLRPQEHEGFHADYVGTTNRGKMYPRFIEMMDRVQVPGMKVRICGGPLDPEMSLALDASPDPNRFECRGFIEDIRSVLQTSDTFAYPLAQGTYATMDASLQEAMFAGVPPVIFPSSGQSRFVVDGQTGIVAHSEDEFISAIEYLHRNPDRRRLLGRNARDAALELFDPQRNAAAMMGLIAETAKRPARQLFRRNVARTVSCASARLFLLSQNWRDEDVTAAVEDWTAGRSARLMEFAAELEDEAYQVEGGILHWRSEAMDDPLIRSWAAIWLRRKGRTAEADAETAAALSLGAPADGLAKYAR